MMKISKQKARQLFEEGRIITVQLNDQSNVLRIKRSKLYHSLESVLNYLQRIYPNINFEHVNYQIAPEEVKVKFAGIYWLIQDVKSGQVVNSRRITTAKTLVKYLNSRFMRVLNKGYLMPQFRGMLAL